MLILFIVKKNSNSKSDSISKIEDASSDSLNIEITGNSVV